MFARHFAANFVNLLVVGGIAFAGFVYWAKGQYATNGPLIADTSFEVNSGDVLKPVSKRLASDGIISSEIIFRVSTRYEGKATALKKGKYLIPASSSMEEVLTILTSGRAISEQVTFPEGFTSYQIIARLNDVAELEGELDGLPAEGSLAPNTYAYVKGDTRQKVLQKMVDAQIKILDAAWENRADDLPYEKKEDVLIVASIIEKETPQKDELRSCMLCLLLIVCGKGMKLGDGFYNGHLWNLRVGDPKHTAGVDCADLTLLKIDGFQHSYIIPALPPTRRLANPGKASD